MTTRNIIAATAGFRRVLASCVIVLALVAVAGCGQKGNLYLPDPSARYSQPSAP